MKRTSITSILMLSCLAINAQQIKLNQSVQIAIPNSSLKAFQVKGPQRVLASTERTVGYTDGDSITTSNAYIGQAGTYRIGALLTADKLSDYKGCKVVGIRFALSQSIGKTTAFLYKVNNNAATPVIENTIRRTSEGWNEMRMNSGQEYTITGSEDILFGFDYVESAEMAQEEKGALCFYTPSAENEDASLMLKDDAFYPLTGAGNICVQLIVDVTNMPKYDVRLTHLLAGNKYKQKGEQIDAFLQFNNIGTEDLSSARFGYKFDNGDVTYIDSKSVVKSSGIGSVNKMINMPTDMKAGTHTLTFFADKLNGNEIERPEGDTISNSFVLYTPEKTFKRQKSYVEQYNSQDSYLSSYVNKQMSEVANDDSICMVNTYVEGEPLSIDESNYLDELYSYTYPCFTIDRFYFMGENTIAFDVNDYASLMPSLVSDAVRMLVNEARQNPAFANISLKPTYSDATRTLSLDVTGEVSDEFTDIFGDLGLTVMLTEDKVISRQRYYNEQTQKLQTNKNYEHNQVLRTYLTAATGDKQTISNGKYNAHFTYTLPSTWKAEDVKVIALATKYMPKVTDDNVLDADILNAESCSINGSSAGITSLNTSVATHLSDGIYTLRGTRVEGKLSKGIYIVRQDGKSSKIIIK